MRLIFSLSTQPASSKKLTAGTAGQHTDPQPPEDHQVTANPLAQSDHPFYRNPDEIIVTRSRHCRAGVLCYRASRSGRRTISAAAWAGRRMAHCAPWWRGATQSCARISLDNGLTWLPERYRPIFGFGYPGNLVLEDDAIVTITGASLGQRRPAPGGRDPLAAE